MTVFARRGEKVTRESGEHICTVAYDIPRHSLCLVSSFTDWQIPEPKQHEAMPRDPDGKQWIRVNGSGTIVGWVGGVDLHLERGWASQTIPPLRPEPRRPFLELD